MTVIRQSFCKVNLLLNVLGKRADGFHELETIIQPLMLHDELTFEKTERGVELSCNHPALPIDSSNLVTKAAEEFFRRTGLKGGARIHLDKRLPLAAGLGGGSANAAITLLALNDLYGKPLPSLQDAAAALGSDVPFFLADGPALASGRGEFIQRLPAFRALDGTHFLLIHPGFGVSTPWAYQNLAAFPESLNGERGRAERLIKVLDSGSLEAAAAGLYNSLEAPVLRKYPLLAIIQDFLRAAGAAAVLMSGSGSTTFAVFHEETVAREAQKRAEGTFAGAWTAVVAA